MPRISWIASSAPARQLTGKVELCKYWPRGSCKRATSCRFPHDIQGLRNSEKCDLRAIVTMPEPDGIIKLCQRESANKVVVTALNQAQKTGLTGVSHASEICGRFHWAMASPGGKSIWITPLAIVNEMVIDNLRVAFPPGPPMVCQARGSTVRLMAAQISTPCGPTG